MKKNSQQNHLSSVIVFCPIFKILGLVKYFFQTKWVSKNLHKIVDDKHCDDTQKTSAQNSFAIYFTSTSMKMVIFHH